MNKSKIGTKQLVICAILTAIVVILQYMGSFIKLGPFSISLVLIPVVIGAALCGAWAGAWLGGVFGLVVLLSGDASPFMAVSFLGTVATVMLKGILCGYAAGLTYGAMCKISRLLAVVMSAVVCPVVNTGIFLAGCKIFFMELIAAWSGGTGVGKYMIFGLVGMNFIVEMAVNVFLTPIILRIINYAENCISLGRGKRNGW